MSTAVLPGWGAPVFAGGFCVHQIIVEGHNRMRIFQEEIFGLVVVVPVAGFSDQHDAVS
ncbi:hypothetical protein [Arthrobacter sp. VKM Ac-2550]|uniref:hypothetical protein n=1 Tax=Crystallibacter permensis TaxID=1938888 RepID=UPI0022272A24|nr:hypothetical protein [Arthrobacter sp. VKM Ac-2550]MCW2132702.1 hypothetical protein [Arthrobacter sp. VKM Ac-2550]